MILLAVPIQVNSHRASTFISFSAKPKSSCKLAWLSQIEVPTLFAKDDISISVIVYLSTVRYMHICRGLLKHFKQQLTPWLLLILRGIKKRQADVHPRRKRLPITIQLLGRIRNLQSKQLSYTNITLWAMCCLAFFGFLRVSEFTILTESLYKPSRHQSVQDIAVNSRTSPRLPQLFLRQSKTDPFKQGVKSLH